MTASSATTATPSAREPARATPFTLCSDRSVESVVLQGRHQRLFQQPGCRHPLPIDSASSGGGPGRIALRTAARSLGVPSGSIGGGAEGLHGQHTHRPLCANLYLREMDAWFERRGALYARYSDDVVFFGSEREIAIYREAFEGFLEKYRLRVSPEKVGLYAPGEPWAFWAFQPSGCYRYRAGDGEKTVGQDSPGGQELVSVAAARGASRRRRPCR